LAQSLITSTCACSTPSLPVAALSLNSFSPCLTDLQCHLINPIPNLTLTLTLTGSLHDMMQWFPEDTWTVGVGAWQPPSAEAIAAGSWDVVPRNDGRACERARYQEGEEHDERRGAFGAASRSVSHAATVEDGSRISSMCAARRVVAQPSQPRRSRTRQDSLFDDVREAEKLAANSLGSGSGRGVREGTKELPGKESRLRKDSHEAMLSQQAAPIAAPSAAPSAPASASACTAASTAATSSSSLATKPPPRVGQQKRRPSSGPPGVKRSTSPGKSIGPQLSNPPSSASPAGVSADESLAPAPETASALPPGGCHSLHRERPDEHLSPISTETRSSGLAGSSTEA